MTRVLVAEDDDLVSSFVVRGLEAHGYECVVATTVEAVVALAKPETVDIVLLDLGLADGDGLEVLRSVRGAGSRIPVIVLTGQRHRDAVVLLDAGADDYMRKPFHTVELIARIRARLRARSADRNELRGPGVHLDLRRRRVTVGARTFELSGREFALLELFLINQGQVLTRDVILTRVWAGEVADDTNVLNVYVGALRHKLGRDAIETVRGVGYRFVGA
jgi:DNA-binding response OmpR family regulator